jgi:hypothetical protein
MTLAETRAQVVESRRAQGLPDHVTAEMFLYRLAREVLAARREHDGAPGTRMPGRRDHPAAAKQQKGRGYRATRG